MGLRARHDAAAVRLEEESARADEAEVLAHTSQTSLDAMTRELREVRARAEDTQRLLVEEGAALQERQSRAAAAERELRASLDAAERRCEAGPPSTYTSTPPLPPFQISCLT